MNVHYNSYLTLLKLISRFEYTLDHVVIFTVYQLYIDGNSIDSNRFQIDYCLNTYNCLLNKNLRKSRKCLLLYVYAWLTCVYRQGF
ncbi:unnamed protein product [Heterobilharzia americana]|nr:unnamed protein product [Heterobilharzia americana]